MTCCRCGEVWVLFDDALDSLGWRWCKDCAALELGKLPRPVQRRPVGAFDKVTCEEDSDPTDTWVEHIHDAFEEDR